MSDQGEAQRRSAPSSGASEDGASHWIFPIGEAIATTRHGLLAAGAAFGIAVSVLLTVLSIVLALVEPGSVAVWQPAAFLPFIAFCGLAWRWDPMTPLRALLLAVLAAVSVAVIALAVSDAPRPDPAGTAAFPLTIVVIATVLVTTAADRWSSGLLGAAAGYVLGEGAAVLTGIVAGLPLEPDLAAAVVAAATALLSAFFPIARARSRARAGPLDAADLRARASRSRELERRELVAELHDTVLSDLTAIALRRPGPFSDVERAQLATSLAASALLPALRTSGTRVLDDLVAVAAAGGLSLMVDGDGEEVEALPEPMRAVAAAALEQCVVNVVRHASVGAARLRVVVSGTEISLLLEDDGVGFDPSTVADDRFGLSESIRGRIERAGGRVEVRSAPGAGTRVGITLPRGSR